MPGFGGYIYPPMVRAWREFGRVCGSQLVVLAPPYRNPTSLATLERGAALPLGSLVLGDGDATIAVLAELTALSYRAPWAVPCLALPAHQQPLEPLLLLVTELRDRLVVVHRSGAQRVDDWAQIVRCVRRRAAPTAAELARWVARRLRQREIEIPLRHQFEEALQGTPADAGLSVASYSRLFAHYGTYTARDWRALGRLAELGILDEDDRVELLDGQIVEMTPIGGAHAACVIRLNDLLSRRSAHGINVSVQNPVVLAERWEPQPDIAVLRRPGGSAGAWLPNPPDVLLVIEVADTSLERDRDLKIPRYAAAGIPEAWLVDLVGDAISVCRQPASDGYGEIVTVGRGQVLRPLLLPGVAIAADEILG